MCPVSSSGSPLDVMASACGAGRDMMAGEESSETQYTECPVCGSLAERRHCFHYGGVCCYSCRAFFRRAHQATKNPNFSCKNNGACKVTAKTRRKCQKCRYDLCLSAGMDPEMVLNAEQKQFRFRNCLKKKMLKELEQQQHHPGHERDVRDEQERPRDAATPPSPLPPPPPMVPILGGAYDGSRIAAAFGTSMLSAFSKPPAPPIFVPSSPRREYEMPAVQERRPPHEYPSIEHSDERDLKIADVQLSYSQALDECPLPPHLNESLHAFHSGHAASLTKLDFAGHIFRISQHFSTFAERHRGFLSLEAEDRATLLRKNTALFVCYALARYLSAETGEDQLRWLLDANTPQNLSGRRLERVHCAEFNARTKIFGSSDRLSTITREISAAGAVAGLSYANTFLVANLILFNTNGIPFSELRNGARVHAAFIEGIGLLKRHQRGHVDVEAVLGIVHSSLETMQAVFNETVAWPEDGAPPADFPMLGLRMPVTPEEDAWLDAHLGWFDKAFWSVRADEEVASLLLERSPGGEQQQLRWSEACIGASSTLAARMRRVAQAQPDLPPLLWERLWARNGHLMVLLCAARLDACRTGEEQHRFLVDPDFEGGGLDLCYRRLSDWSNQVEVFGDDRAFRLMAAVLLLETGTDKHLLPPNAIAARQRYAQLAVRRLGIAHDGLGKVLDRLCRLTLTTLSSSDSSSTCSGTSSS